MYEYLAVFSAGILAGAFVGLVNRLFDYGKNERRDF